MRSRFVTGLDAMRKNDNRDTVMTTAARPAVRAVDAWTYFAIAISIDIANGLRAFPAVLRGALPDPDSYMRLDRLRDILAHRAPLHAVLRDASGAGDVLPWAHLMDSVLLLLAAPLRPFLSEWEASQVAAVLVGPLGVGLLGIATAWMMAPLSDCGWRWTAPASVALATPIVTYGIPGVAGHRVALVLAAAIVAGLAGRAAAGDRASGYRLGACAGAAIWLSPEAMPFVLMAFGGVGGAWILRTSRRNAAPEARDLAIGDALASAGTVFLLIVACAFWADPPSAGFGSVEIDRISVVYVALSVVACVIGWALWGLDRATATVAGKIAIAAIVTAASLGLWVASFPAVLRGPDGLMNPDQARVFFGPIVEMRPVASVAGAVGFQSGGAMAALLLVWLAVSRRCPLWAYTALCVGAMLVLGLLHMRFAIYSAAAAAATLPVMLTECTRTLANRRPFAQAAARIAIIALMLLPGRAYIEFGGATADNWTVAQRLSGSADCGVGGLGEMLAPYDGEVVLTEADDVPELLYRTGILTVGSFYHRNITGFMRLRAAWRTPSSDTVPEAVRVTGAALVLACRHTGRSSLVADLPPETLLDRLERGDVPTWLHEVARNPASGNVLYRIVGSDRRRRRIESACDANPCPGVKPRPVLSPD